MAARLRFMEADQKSDFSRYGFLGRTAESGIPIFRELYSDWWNFHRKLNEFAQTAFGQAEVNVGDAGHLLAYGAFSRVLSAFQGTLLAMERGMSTEAKVLLRTMTETAIFIAALAKDQEVAKRIIYADEGERLKRLRAFLDTQDAIAGMSAEEIQQLRGELTALEEQKKAGQFPDAACWNLAQLAGVQSLFNLHYRELSRFAHPAPSGLAEDLLRDESGRIIGIKVGPDYSEAPSIMRIASLMLLVVLLAADEFLHLGSAESLKAFRKEFDILADTHSDQNDESGIGG